MTFTFAEMATTANVTEFKWYHAGILIGIGYLLHLIVEGVIVNVIWYQVIKPLVLTFI